MRTTNLATLLLAVFLGACGGGGGGGGDGGSGNPPATPAVNLTPTSIKTFRFVWGDVADETEYRLLEDANGSSGFTPIATLGANTTSHDLVVSLPKRINARYVLQACNSQGCADSAPVAVSGALVEAIGYVKASNTGEGDLFGISVALSGDGNTLAVGATSEDSNARGINGNEEDNSVRSAGAVYVFVRNGTTWTQQAYVKASNTGRSDQFGTSVALAGDGNTLAVGATGEDSNARGINGNGEDNSVDFAGAVYVFVRNGTTWTQQAYVKASNTGEDFDQFGVSVALAGDGNTLAVGAHSESSNARGINGNEEDDSAGSAGAVYVFVRNGTTWTQQAYVKASNTGGSDQFGTSVALAGDGDTLAVGARGEDSNARGINGNEEDDSVPDAGAVYLF